MCTENAVYSSSGSVQLAHVDNELCHEYIRDESMQPRIPARITAFSKLAQQNITHGHGNVISIPT